MDPVLLRSKVLDEKGLMSRPWARQQIQLQSAANQVSTVTNNVTDVQVASGFDDTCTRDFQPAIWDAYLLDAASAPGVYDDSDLQGLLASVETPNHLNIQQQLDELRALVAASDPSIAGALGSAAFQATSAFDPAGAAASAQSAAEAFSANGSNISSGTVAAARLPNTIGYLNAIQSWGQTNTYTQQLRAAALAMACRVVTASTDTASSATDHTLILNGVTTETLPSAPASGTEFYLINIGASASTISGNGHNISVNGVSATTYSLAAGAGMSLVYDSANTLWRLALTSPGFVPLNPANNLSEVSSASTARSNLGLGSAATQASSAFDAAGTAAALLSSANTWTAAQTFGSSSSVNASSLDFGSNGQSGSESRTAVQNVNAGATFAITLPDNSGGRIRIRAIQSGVSLCQLYDNVFTSHGGSTTLGSSPVQIGAGTEFTISLSGNTLTVTNTYSNTYYAILVDAW